MKHNKRIATASVLTLIVLALLVAGVSAAVISFSLVQSAEYVGGNWVWSGTASTTPNDHYICIGFPGTAIAPVACTGNISGAGLQLFNCSIPATAFSGVPGTTSWSIFSNNQAGCQGPQGEQITSGNFVPTAVSLSNFQAGPLGQAGLWLLLPLIALLLGAGYVVVFKVLRAAPQS